MRKRLIVTADDFGYSVERNRGIVEAYKAGGITRASLLVNADAAKHAVKLAGEHCIPLGLHLNLTEGYPLSPRDKISTLVDSNGVLLGKTGLQKAWSEGSLDMQQVALEMQTQIKRFQELCGQKPLYVDGHNHTHVIPGLSEVFASVLKEHEILETRLPAELDVQNCDWLKASEKNFYETVTRYARDAALAFNNKGIRYSDGFVGMVTMGYNMTLEHLTSRILATITQQQNLTKGFGQSDDNNSASTITTGASSTANRCANAISTETCSITQDSPPHRNHRDTQNCDTSTCTATSGCERSGLNSIDATTHGNVASIDCNGGSKYVLQQQQCIVNGDGIQSGKCDIVQQRSVQLIRSVDAEEKCAFNNKNDEDLKNYDARNKVPMLTVELMVHPGYASQPRDLGCGIGADDFACSLARKHELDFLTSHELLNWYKSHDFELVSTCLD